MPKNICHVTIGQVTYKIEMPSGSILIQALESSDRYLTTVGVKIDRREITVQDTHASLILWDLNGEDEFMDVQESYIRGTS